MSGPRSRDRNTKYLCHKCDKSRMFRARVPKCENSVRVATGPE